MVAPNTDSTTNTNTNTNTNSNTNTNTNTNSNTNTNTNSNSHTSLGSENGSPSASASVSGSDPNPGSEDDTGPEVEPTGSTTDPHPAYDVIVVGAGVAGSLFARDLAREGYRVCLLEKRARDDLGHDWWDSVDKSVFDTVELAHPPPDELYQRGTMFICSPRDTVRVMVRDPGKNYQIDRKRLAQRMIEDALDAEVELRDGVTVTGPLIDAEHEVVIGVTVEDGEPVRATLTADCSGYHGVVRTNIPFSVDFQKTIPRTDTFLTYREIHRKRDACVENHWLWRFAQYKGVSWASFNQDDYVDFFGGRIDIPEETIAPEAMARQYIDRFAHTYEPEIAMGGYGAPIPVGAAMDSFVANGFLIVGDAAKQCHPLNGSGVASSLFAAHLAAKSVAAALATGDVTKRALWSYNAAYHRSELNRHFAFLNILQKYIVQLTEAQIELLFTRNIVDFRALTAAGGFQSKSTLATLKLMLNNLDQLPLLLLLKRALEDAQRLQTLEREYPDHYLPQAFARWRTRTQGCYP